MKYVEREAQLAYAINHLGKEKGAFHFQWVETVVKEGKISGWRVYSLLIS